MTRFQRTTAAVLFPLLLSLPPDARAQTADERQVLATLESFLAAMRVKDTAGMKAHVDSLTRFTLLRPGPTGTRVFLLSGADFIRLATQPDGPTYDEPVRNPVVQVDGDLATVWAEYQVRLEGKVSHCGYDAVHLARLGGRWKILNLSDTFRREGCGEPWP